MSKFGGGVAFCCCSNRVGAKFVAWVCIVYTGLTLVAQAFNIFTTGTTLQVIEETRQLFRNEYDKGKINQSQYELISTYFSLVEHGLIPMLVLGVLMSLLILASSALVLVGIGKDKHLYLLPWLIIMMIVWVVTSLVFFGGAAFYFYASFQAAGLIALGMGVVWMSLVFYFWWVVKREYQEIRDVTNPILTTYDNEVHLQAIRLENPPVQGASKPAQNHTVIF